MQNEMFGLIYTGESNLRLRDLTFSRSVAAVPFAGRYRCIDFVMSSMVNSGISNLGIITQRNYHSLMDHLGSGKEWELRRKRDGLFILPPFVTKENTGIYTGTVDAFRSVMGYVRRSTQRYIVLTGSHTIYNTTYFEMLKQHQKTGADITIMYNETPPFNEEDRFDDMRLVLDENNKVTDLEYNAYQATTNNTACDAYIMERSLFEYLIEDAAAHGLNDFMRDILLKRVGDMRMYGWKYNGYVARLNSLPLFFKHNMELLDRNVRSDLFNPEHPIYTKVKDEVPARFTQNGSGKNSLIADGCVIEGEVENSILFRGVRVQKGTRVKNCIVMQAADIGKDCELSYAVLDKGTTIRAGRKLAGYESFPIIIRKGATI